MSDQIFNDEVKRELEGLLPCSVSSTKSVTPDIFDGVNEKYCPVFKIGCLTKNDIVKINELAQYCVKNQQVDVKGTFDFVWSKLKGWENLADANSGDSLDFNKDVFDAFPFKLVMSLYKELQIIAGITNREKQVLTS